MVFIKSIFDRSYPVKQIQNDNRAEVKGMGKVVKTIALIFAAAVILLIASVPFVNDHVARKTANELAEIPLPEQTEYIEKISRAAKLVGNGNGIQYLGAALIKSELSLEELEEYYSEYHATVRHQTGRKIEGMNSGKLEFKSEISGDNFYVVYKWGNNDHPLHGFYEDFDLRGH